MVKTTITVDGLLPVMDAESVIEIDNELVKFENGVFLFLEDGEYIERGVRIVEQKGNLYRVEAIK